jgi:hypothetical protein
MLSPELAQIYPRLAADGGKEKSPKTSKYNCVAWAAAWDKNNWWQPDTFEPGMYWPEGVQRDGTIQCFICLFETLGYHKCDSSKMEIFYEKVAIYENVFGEFKHVAREKISGVWWSKLGEDQDVYHNTPEGLECSGYGKPKQILKRSCKPFVVFVRTIFKFASIFKKRANII